MPDQSHIGYEKKTKVYAKLDIKFHGNFEGHTINCGQNVGTCFI